VRRREGNGGDEVPGRGGRRKARRKEEAVKGEIRGSVGWSSPRAPGGEEGGEGWREEEAEGKKKRREAGLGWEGKG
jgi:hypothetical protein